MAKEYLIEYTKFSKGDASAMRGIAGHRTSVDVGKVRITVVVDGCDKVLALTNVVHTPGMPLNLISMGQLDQSNCP